MNNFRKIMQEKPNQVHWDIRYEVVFETTDGKVHIQPARNYIHAKQLVEMAKNHPAVNPKSVKVRSCKVD